ncbi:hypothetical protein JB92DRAFT_2974637 [Gautieria morchelliformis]|nr:hypothetical protein JB92DRAFT_2974637 [Gautieria morchelliformis]
MVPAEDTNAKFPAPGKLHALPPSPTPHNPGAVHPPSSPSPAPPQTVPGTHGAPSSPPPRNVLGNAFAFDAHLKRLEDALDRVILDLEGEARVGVSKEQAGMSDMFKEWRREVGDIRGGSGGVSVDLEQKVLKAEKVDARAGGLLVD